MKDSQPVIYLASQSSRRKQLLKQAGIVFTPLSGSIDETPKKNELPQDYVVRVALEKAHYGWSTVKEQALASMPVLAADTTVVLDNKILGKPTDNYHAYETLRALSGRTHQVMSSVAVSHDGHIDTVLSVTRVQMARLCDQQIKRYISSGESEGKAGSYAIQGLGATLIKRIEGSYSGVMGLPLYETTILLKKFAIANLLPD